MERAYYTNRFRNCRGWRVTSETYRNLVRVYTSNPNFDSIPDPYTLAFVNRFGRKMINVQKENARRYAPNWFQHKTKLALYHAYRKAFFDALNDDSDF